MVGFVLRNTLSDFGSVARGVCQVSDDGYLQHIVELTKVERDGNGARNTDAAGTVTKFSGDEPVSMNMWGFTPQVFDQLRERFEKFLEANAADLKSECYIPNTVGELVRPGRRGSKCCARAIPGSASLIARTARASSRAYGASSRTDSILKDFGLSLQS